MFSISVTRRISMNGTRVGFLGLILLFGAAFLVPANLTGIARAAPAWMGDLAVVQMLDSPSDYRWMGTWDPVYDYDWQRHYSTAYVRDCDRCAVRYYDRSAARDCDRCAAHYSDRCDSYPYATDYRCDLFGCGWVR
jgi:hypothetical protein